MSTISASTTLTTAYSVTGDTTGTLVFKTGATPTTAMTIDTSQNVGIGTGSPASALDITRPNGTATQIRLLQSTLESWQIGMPAATASLTFANSGTEQMRLTTSGSLGIGTNSPVTKLQVANGNVTATGYSFLGASSATLGVVTTNAALHSISGDTTTYGYGISTNTSGGLDIMANQASQPIRFWCGTNNASPTKRLTLDPNGNLLVHTADAGIVFNKTGALNNSTLNDYEVGTWTPTMASGGTMNSVAFATYVKIGRLVTVNCYFTCTPTNNASSFTIGGLPFVNNGAASNYTAGTLGYTGSLNASTWHGPIVTANSTTFYFHQNNSTAVVLNSAFGGAANEIIVSISYHTA